MSDKITGNEHALGLVRPGGLIEEGLTIRQYFAAMAMQGLLANNVYHNPNEKDKMIKVDSLADTSVVYSDALIKALKK